MAFHVACPITCKRICFCSLGFPSKLQHYEGRNEFLSQIGLIEEFLKDPWLIRVSQNATVQVAVPKVAPPPPPPLPPPSLIVSADDDDLLSAQNKRAALQRKAAVASLAAEDFARRFESGALLDAPKDSTAEDQNNSNINVMCRLCFSGENEGSERARRMLPCRSCGKKYHRSCLKTWSQHRDLFHWSLWTCPSCRICEVCRRTGEPNKFKFCKRCDGAVHCYCMQPPHKNVSSGPYLCSKHTKCHSCGSNVPGNGLSLRWFLGYTCCDACGRLFTKGNYCPVCLKVYRDSEATPMVCCDVCQRWVHCQCDGISDERYLQFQIDGNLPYTCPTCRGECYQVRDLEDAVRELWRRRDEADRDLIASLREAAGLPTEEEFFSISPFSDDDDDDGPRAIRSEHGRAKFSFKNIVDFSPQKTKESVKKLSSKKHVKKKALQLPMNITTDANLSDQHDAPSETSHPHQADLISSLTGSGSPAVRICSVNEQDGLKDKCKEEVAGSSEDRKTVLQFKNKISDNGVNEDVGKGAGKPQTMKGTKLVIHLGGRNKTITNSPRSDSSSYQKEQEVMLNGSEAVSQNRMGDYIVDRFDGTSNSDDGHRVGSPNGIKGVKPRERNIIKLGKGKLPTSGTHAESEAGTRLSSPESTPSFSLRRINEASAASVGVQPNVSKSEKVVLRKLPDSKNEISGDKNRNSKQEPTASDTLVKDSRPLLRLKFKTPYPGSWPLHGEEERVAIKGQRSKRKRPSPLVEKPKQQEERDVIQEENVMDEIMDANWVLKKLGRDAVGKRVEVHQQSDNSWHKGVVGDVIDGTSLLSIDLDDGRAKTLELGKHGIRFIPHKDKRLKP